MNVGRQTVQAGSSEVMDAAGLPAENAESSEKTGSKWLRPQRRWWVIFALVLAALGVARVRAIEGTLPYSQHVDEGFLTHQAVSILRSGDANPHFFRYPSLPIYLTTFAMKVAGLASGAPPPSAWTVPLRGAAYVPEVVYDASRLLFALTSIAALACVGVIARSVYRSNLAMVLAPLILSRSHVFEHSTAEYLSVDVVTLFFVTAALATTFAAWERESYVATSVVPGVLSGMAAASKYNSALVLVPLGLHIVLTGKWTGQGLRSQAGKLAVLGAAAAAAFVACVPYSVLDRGQFMADVAWEIHHYKTGHPGQDGPAGVPQFLFYLRSLSEDYEPFSLGLAAVGLVFGLFVAPRRAATLASFPLAMLVHMSTNRVHFLRTVLPVFALVPVFVAGGLIALARIATPAFWMRRKPTWSAALDRLPAPFRTPWWPSLVAVAVVASYAARAHRGALLDLDLAPDTRNVVARFLRAHAGNARVFIPPEIGFSSERLSGLRVTTTAPALADLERRVAHAEGSECFVVRPVYGVGRSRIAKRNDDRIEAELRSRRAVDELPVAGAKVAMPDSVAPRFLPDLNPSLDVYRLPKCGPIPASKTGS
jgi:hypothetical protein